jgi:hypothetical protein
MLDMHARERRTAYLSVWVLALAFGWIEASVVVYLRAVGARDGSLAMAHPVVEAQAAFVALPEALVALEMAREACTILLLGAVAWLAGRRPADRAGAFLLSFGIWDLTYYAVLRLVLGWPESLGTWDVLFLIPRPWVAPVWAPVTAAALFVVAGTFLYWTPGRERQFEWSDVAVFLTSGLLTIASFLGESGVVLDRRPPDRFPVWLFWSGVLLGVGGLLRLERRRSPGSELTKLQ